MAAMIFTTRLTRFELPLFYMIPRVSTDNLGNVTRYNPEFVGKFSATCSQRIQPSHFDHFLLCKAMHSVLLTFKNWLSSLSHAIISIILVRSRTKVKRVAARRIIANYMPNNYVIWNRSIGQYKGKTTSVNLSSLQTKSPIPPTSQTRFPRPTLIGPPNVHLAPETSGYDFGKFIFCRTCESCACRTLTSFFVLGKFFHSSVVLPACATNAAGFFIMRISPN